MSSNWWDSTPESLVLTPGFILGTTLSFTLVGLQMQNHKPPPHIVTLSMEHSSASHEAPNIVACSMEHSSAGHEAPSPYSDLLYGVLAMKLPI